MEKKFYYNGMYILNEGDSAETNVTNLVGMTRIKGRQNGADETAYFMKDAHGNAVKVLDSEDFLADYEYDIWGNQTQEATNIFDNPFRYCSEYMGEESGLIYLRARYYDPGTGRFTQEDPIKDGLNWYVYAGNNPIMFVDPSGEDAILITNQNAVGIEGVATVGHTSALYQDSNGNWYYT